jgi:hypothetical protein
MNPYLKWAHTYKPTYFMSSRRFAEIIFRPTEEITPQQASEAIEHFTKQYPQLITWRERQHQPHCD